MRYRSAIALAAVVAAHAAASPPDVQVHELVSDFSMGYKLGVKQPLGTYHAGMSAHQLTRSLWVNGKGHPDYVLWVDESTGDHGLVETPNTDEFPPPQVINPGGMIVFDADGHLWLNTGARADDMPFDLYRSTNPFDPTSYETVLDDYITEGASTTACLGIHDGKLLMFWRHLGSALALKVKARVRRYDIAKGFDDFELERDLGEGAVNDDLGQIGIEQLWMRTDPRFDRSYVTWQWFNVADHTFGSNPFLYTDDAGDTWRRADGTPLGEDPANFEQIDPVLVPVDHLRNDGDTHWLPRGIGATPSGVNWITLPEGNSIISGWTLNLYRFFDGAWTNRPVTEPLWSGSRAHAVGATKDLLVVAYSPDDARNTLEVRWSHTNGATWSDPVTVDVIPEDEGERTITWASFAQPAVAYEDNAFRVFYTYYREEDGTFGYRYENNVRWAKIDITPPCPGDFNLSGTADVIDFVAWQQAFLAGDPGADCNTDGQLDILDFVCFQQVFQAGCD